MLMALSQERRRDSEDRAAESTRNETLRPWEAVLCWEGLNSHVPRKELRDALICSVCQVHPLLP